MHHQHANRNPSRDVERVLGFGHRPLALSGVTARDRQPPAPPPRRVRLADRRVQAAQRESRARQPLLQVRNRGWIAVIEVRARREDLDRFESVRRNLDEMSPAQALMVVEVRRHPELSFSHGPELTFYI